MSDNLDNREGFKGEELEWQEQPVKIGDPAYTDTKTGAWNSNAFLILGPVGLKEAVRDGDPISLVFLDVNNMHDLNKRYGHQGVDKMLEGFVNDTKETLREVDNIFRWGGDEFILLLRKTSLDALRSKVLPKIRQTADKNKVPFSIGVSVNQTGDSIFDMVDRADREMYKHKATQQK